MTLNSAFLGTLRIEVGESHFLQDTPAGWRRIDVFSGGRLEGPRITASIVSGGADALLRDRAGTLHPDVRLTLRTDDGALVFVSYRGLRHGPAAVMARIAQGENVAADEYYLRTAIFFETGASTYDWLNRVLAVGVGQRTAEAAIYRVYEIL